MHQAGEPSVEEILASIKKVIARDNRDAAAAPRQAAEPARQAAAEDAEDEVLDLGAIGECVDDDAEAGVPPLVGSETASSIGESLAALAMMAQPPAAPQIVRSGETSLEGMVRELLRPALAEWLDKNLPPMVEKLVAVEIARIVGKKG